MILSAYFNSSGLAHNFKICNFTDVISYPSTVEPRFIGFIFISAWCTFGFTLGQFSFCVSFILEKKSSWLKTVRNLRKWEKRNQLLLVFGISKCGLPFFCLKNFLIFNTINVVKNIYYFRQTWTFTFTSLKLNTWAWTTLNIS